MAKRLNNTDKWKNQRWFRALDPYYKLAWEYLNGMCDVAGRWKINCPDMLDDLRIPPPFSLVSFITACNTDYNIETGELIENHRLVRTSDNCLWVTTFLLDQYESKGNVINPYNNFAKSAIMKLVDFGLLAEALRRGFLPLSIPLPPLPEGVATGCEGVKEKEKEMDKALYEIIYNKDAGPIKGFEGGIKPHATPSIPLSKPVPTPFLPPLVQNNAEMAPSTNGIVPPAMGSEEFILFQQTLIDDHLFIDPLMASRHIYSVEILKEWIQRFHIHIAAEEKTNKDYKQYKKHFKNWIALQDPPAAATNGSAAHGQNGKRSRTAEPRSVPVATAADLEKYKKNKKETT